MLAREITSNVVKPLQDSDTGEHALLVMHELNVNQMPVTEDKKYIGVISLEEITVAKQFDKPISQVHTSLKRPYVHQSSHLFDVMKAGLEYNVRIIPVLSDKDDSYVGVVSAESCLKAFSELNSISDEGGIVEVSVAMKNYSMTEIARIIEDNGVKILALYTNIDSSTNRVDVTIKTNSNELASVISAFERHGYEIKGFFHEQEYTEDLKENYDAFLRYMNV
ncbi:MAG TPA: CBS domain-containing protein [Chitinophagales bacterium]